MDLASWLYFFAEGFPIADLYSSHDDHTSSMDIDLKTFDNLNLITYNVAHDDACLASTLTSCD